MFGNGSQNFIPLSRKRYVAGFCTAIKLLLRRTLVLLVILFGCFLYCIGSVFFAGVS